MTIDQKKSDAEVLSTLTNEELWRLFPILLTPYRPEWTERFERQKNRLQVVIASNDIVRIRHIGSTAVPGLLAKPTIDVLLEISENADVDAIINSLESDGWIYSPQPKNPPPGAMFLKGYSVEGFVGQAFHLHIRYPGDWPEVRFRDRLRADSAVASEYAALKVELASRFKFNRDEYTQGKTAFVQKYSSSTFS